MKASVDHIHWEGDHRLCVQLRAEDERPFATLLTISETPGLQKAFNDFCGAIEATVEAVFVDIFAPPEIPDTAPNDRRPCRVCDVTVIPVVVNGKFYCREHAPA